MNLFSRVTAWCPSFSRPSMKWTSSGEIITLHPAQQVELLNSSVAACTSHWFIATCCLVVVLQERLNASVLSACLCISRFSCCPVEKYQLLQFRIFFIHSFIHPFDLSLSLSRCFYPVFFHIQMLWELVLLGEALVVMAPSPAESSDTVLALVR